MVDEIRALQLTNDAELKEVEYMRSVSESNRAYRPGAGVGDILWDMQGHT